MYIYTLEDSPQKGTISKGDMLVFQGLKKQYRF